MFWQHCPLRLREGGGYPPLYNSRHFFQLCGRLDSRERRGHGLETEWSVTCCSSGSPWRSPGAPSARTARPPERSRGLRALGPAAERRRDEDAIVGGDEVSQSRRNLACSPILPPFRSHRPAPTPPPTHTWRERKCSRETVGGHVPPSAPTPRRSEALKATRFA